MSCFECKWPNLQRTREGEICCPRCGAKAPYNAKTRPREKAELPFVATTYTAILGVFALVLPFLVPIIIEVSLAHP